MSGWTHLGPPAGSGTSRFFGSDDLMRALVAISALRYHAFALDLWTYTEVGARDGWLAHSNRRDFNEILRKCEQRVKELRK